MRSIDHKAEYHRVVSALATEFDDEIADGVAKNVAGHLVASYTLTAEGDPIVRMSVEYEGGPVETLERALNPYEIMLYTNARLVEDAPSVWHNAVEALAQDLRTAANE